jgi:hypothetical protein
MITFSSILAANGLPFVMRTLTHPAVYLDTWALRLFAEGDRPLGIRFREAVVSARGTLVLSHLSLAEFSVFGDVRHVQAVSTYVDTLYPNIFFSKFDPFDVIKAEIPIIVGRARARPRHCCAPC